MLFLEIFLCLVGLVAWLALISLTVWLFDEGLWGRGLLAGTCVLLSVAAVGAFLFSRPEWRQPERADGCYRLHHVSEPVVTGKTVTETSSPVYDPIPCPAS